VTVTPKSGSANVFDVNATMAESGAPFTSFDVTLQNEFGSEIQKTSYPSDGTCKIGGTCTVEFTANPAYDGKYLIKVAASNSKGSGVLASTTSYTKALTKEKTDTPKFKDISSQSADFKASITWAYQYGITTGTDDTHFAPKKATNRGQMALFLWRIAGKPAISSSLPNPFKDNTNAVTKDAVRWLVSTGVTTGYECTAKGKPAKACTKKGDLVYQPSKSVTRAQMAMFMYRLAGNPSFVIPTNPFKDISSQTADFQNAILWLVSQEITTGTDKTHYSPSKSVTRAQMAAFMKRYAEHGKFVS
jgi:hypothetical protein